MTTRRFTLFCLLLLALTPALIAGKNKDEEEPKTQTLEEPKDPPAVATGEATRLVFHVSPLSAKGLLSQQTRDALSAVLKANSGATVIHLRAFVAGNGDVRRIPQIVSEVFTKKHAPLPSVSVIQVGALPLTGAQVVFESISEGKKTANPSGLSFVPAQESIDHMPANPVAVTCFVDDIAKAGGLAAKFPAAAVDIVQAQRLAGRPVVACEAVVAGGQTGQLAFTGTQAAFGYEPKDANLAFERIGRALSTAGTAPAGVLLMNVYALSKPISDMAMKAQAAQGGVAPGVAPILVEGIGSTDASFAVDAVASSPRSQP